MKRPPVTDPYTGAVIPEAELPPVRGSDATIETGYDATKPPVLGNVGYPATFLVVDADGLAVSMQSRAKRPEDGDDLRQRDMKRIYRKQRTASEEPFP